MGGCESCADFREPRSKAPNPSSTSLQWQPCNWKLNFDGTIFPYHHRVGAGFILCDDLGKVVDTVIHLEAHLADPIEVKLLAIFRGLQLCVPLGIPKLAVEIDCLVAMQALKEGVESVAAHRHLLMEILRLRKNFVVCNFNHISRLGNHVAHFLARYAW